MKSSFKALVVALVVALSVFTLSSVLFAADSKTYDASKDFSTTQDKQSMWQYEYNDGSGFKSSPFYYEPWNVWAVYEDPGAEGIFANIGAEDGNINLHPDRDSDAGLALDVAVSWTAPSDGKVTIPAANVTHVGYNDPDSSKGTKVWIELNGTKHNETTLGFEQSADLASITLNVKQGDKVYFAANNNGRGGNNTTLWPITLSFEGAAAADTGSTNGNATPAAETPANDNPKTGDTGVATYALLAIASLVGIVLITRKRFGTSN